MSLLRHDFETDIRAVQQVDAIPKILDVVCRTTGMGFAAVARVTDSRWICCAARDDIAFGLLPGGELKLETTLCHEIRESRKAVIIDNVTEDAVYRSHHTPAMYGFQSYISVPIFLGNREFFGTLCAIDPKPRLLNTPEVTGMFNLFAELIALNLDAMLKLASSETSLAEQRSMSDIRGQFSAMFEHDLRKSLDAIHVGAQALDKANLNENEAGSLRGMNKSMRLMEGLIDNAFDMARVKVGQAGPASDISSVVKYALALARDEKSDLTARLLRMILLNEAERQGLLQGPLQGPLPS